MNSKLILAAIIVFLTVLNFESSAKAEVYRALGNHFVKKIGPWRIYKQAWEGGKTGCVASNHHAGNQAPVFGLYAVTSKGKVSSRVRFDIPGTAKSNAVARVIIGSSEFRFQHPGEFEHGGHYAKNESQQSKALSTLVAFQKSGSSNKSFYVVTQDNLKYRFDARKTSETVAYLADKCVFNVKISGSNPAAKNSAGRVQSTDSGTSSQISGKPILSGGNSYGLLVKQIPKGTKAKYKTSDGRTYSMEFLGRSGKHYRVRFTGQKDWIAFYDALGRLSYKTYPSWHPFKISFKPQDCSFVLGNCAYSRERSFAYGPEEKLDGKYQTNLVKKGNWFHLSAKRGGKPFGKKSTYRLTKYNLVAEFRSGGYWEKLVSISN